MSTLAIVLFSSGMLFQNSIGYVWSDGSIYACARPGDDCSEIAIGQLGDEQSPIPAEGGMIGTTPDGYVWSNGDVFACARPGDDCADLPLRHIELPIQHAL